MKITVKNLKQQTFTIEIEPEKTILELKEAIYHDRGGDYPVEKQTLIYSGHILDDTRSVRSYNVDEKKFLVVMFRRESAISGTCSNVKPSTLETSTSNDVQCRDEFTSTTEEFSEPNRSCKNTNDASKKKSAAETVDESTSATEGDSKENDDGEKVISAAEGNASLQVNTAPLNAESHLLMGEEYNRTVASMVEMGYCREMVERAMAASFNNPERAVEYLIAGIPEGSNSLSGSATVSTGITDTVSVVQPLTDGAVAAEGTSSEDPFEFLRSQPQFLQMRSLVYQNPDLLHAVLQQIGQTNPALLQMISENQEAFLTMLNQPLEGQTSAGNQSTRNQTLSQGQSTVPVASTGAPVDRANVAAAVAAAGGETPREAGGDDPPYTQGPMDDESGVSVGPGGVATIHLTPTDRDAIERLKALGFPENLVLQAYFACEKNEQWAANFLISAAFED